MKNKKGLFKNISMLIIGALIGGTITASTVKNKVDRITWEVEALYENTLSEKREVLDVEEVGEVIDKIHNIEGGAGNVSFK